MDRELQKERDLRQEFRINPAEIQGEGEFPCPTCGAMISPDDESGITYDILEIEEQNGLIEQATLRCNKCRTIIHLDLLMSIWQVQTT